MDYSIAKGLTTPLLFTHKGPIHTSSAFAVGTPVLGCPKPIIDIRSNSDTAGAVSLRIFRYQIMMLLVLLAMVQCLPKNIRRSRHHFRRKHHWQSQHHLPQANIIQIPFLLRKKRTHPIKGCVFFWRRRRDLNPRYPFGVYTISNRARSASYATSPNRLLRSQLEYNTAKGEICQALFLTNPPTFSDSLSGRTGCCTAARRNRGLPAAACGYPAR